MFLCMIRAVITTHVALPDPTAFWVSWEGRDASLTCRTLDGALLTSLTGTDYAWLTDAGRTSLKLVAAKPDQRTEFRRLHFFSDKGPFSGGLEDIRKFTLLEVAFEVPDQNAVNDKTVLDAHKGWAERLFRSFVDLYRYLGNDSLAAAVRIDDSPFLQVLIARDYTFNEAEASGSFEQIHLTLQWQSYANPMSVKPVLPADRLGELTRLLRAGKSLHIWEQLVVESRELSQLQGHHDLSIVTIASAFEAYLQLKLRNLCKTKGKTTLRFRSHKRQRELPFEEALEQGTLSAHLLKLYPQELSQVDLTALPEYSCWRTRAYEPRNRIVHEGKRGSGSGDAKLAFEATMSFIYAIEDSAK